MIDEQDDDDFLASLESEFGDGTGEEKPEAEDAPVTYTAEDLEKAKAEAQAAAKAEAEAAFNERRSYFDRRENERQQLLRAKGLILTDDGKDLAVTDPTKLIGSVVGFQPQQARTAEGEDAEPEIDPYDPASIKAHNRWAARQAAKELETTIRAEYAPLLQATGTLIRPVAQEAARSFLGRHDLEGLVDTAEFKVAFDHAMSQLDAAAQANPEQVRQAAGWALSRVPDEIVDDVKQKTVTRKAEAAAQAERDRQREMQQQNQPSGGIRTTNVGTPTFVAQNDVNERQSAAIRDALGSDPDAMAMLKALDAGALKNGVSAVDALNGRLRKAGRR